MTEPHNSKLSAAQRALVDEVLAGVDELPSAEQAAYVRQRCQHDPDVYAEVTSLLNQAAQTHMQDFLEKPADLPGPEAASAEPAPMPERIGPYAIQREIAAGGMGVVYEATQAHPKRRVALKVIRPDRMSSESLRRFEYETQLLGQLQHPGIAQMYHAGIDTSGNKPCPYFAMEYVEGVPMTTYAETNSLSTRRRLQLLARVCEAVHHAHQRGIIHRDLKPANILVDHAGQPKILDFGVARATASDVQATTIHSDIGQMIGTLAYMSPEQAAGDPDEIDTRSDIYSLGVVAYELLTGAMPYNLRRKLIHEAARIIREDDHTPFDTSRRELRGDVESIVSMALEKDKTRRYASAHEFAADIQRHLSDEPIVARPHSAMYQVRKFVKRNRTLVCAAAAVLVVSVGGTIVSVAYARLAAEKTRLAEESKQSLQVFLDFMRVDVPREVVGIQQSLPGSPTPGGDESSGSDFSARLNERLEQLGRERFLGQPLLEATLAAMLGSFDLAHGDIRSAKPLLERGLASSRTAAGARSMEVVTILEILGYLELQKYQPNLAEPRLREALELRRELLGEQDPDVIVGLTNLGMARMGLGDFAGAAALFEEALSKVDSLHGGEHPELAGILNSMGEYAYRTGNVEDARSYFERALVQFKSTYGPRHAHVATTLHNLGMVDQWSGDYMKAEALFTDALEMRRSIHGSGHTSVAQTLAAMIRLNENLGQYELALQLAREALAIDESIHGPSSQPAARDRNLLSRILSKLGRNEEAETECRHAIGILSELGESAEPNLASSLYSLAQILESQGRLPEAEAKAREARSIYRERDGAGHENEVICMNLVTKLLLAQGKYNPAEALAREALDARLQLHADADHLSVADSQELLTAVLIAKGAWAEAEGPVRRCLAIREKLLEPTHHLRWATASALGEVLTGQGRFEEAEERLLASHWQLVDLANCPPGYVAKSLERIITLYTSWGKDGQAESWRKKQE